MSEKGLLGDFSVKNSYGKVSIDVDPYNDEVLFLKLCKIDFVLKVIILVDVCRTFRIDCCVSGPSSLVAHVSIISPIDSELLPLRGP